MPFYNLCHYFFRLQKDPFYDYDLEEEELKRDESKRRQQMKQCKYMMMMMMMMMMTLIVRILGTADCILYLNFDLFVCNLKGLRNYLGNRCHWNAHNNLAW